MKKKMKKHLIMSDRSFNHFIMSGRPFNHFIMSDRSFNLVIMSVRPFNLVMLTGRPFFFFISLPLRENSTWKKKKPTVTEILRLPVSVCVESTDSVNVIACIYGWW